MQFWKNFKVCSTSALFALALFSQTATAQLITGVFEVAGSAFPAELANGDRFTFSLTIDESIMQSGVGRFANSVTAFSLVADPSNTGTWTLGSFGISPVNTFVVNTLGENATIQIGGSGFGTLAGDPFFDIRFIFVFTDDLISGTTLAEVANGAALDYFDALSSISIRSRTQTNNFPTTFASVIEPLPVDPAPNPVPTPGTFLLMLTALGGLLARKRIVSS